MRSAAARIESADWRALAARVIELEGERADARDQARLLTALHNAFTRIASTRAPDDIVEHLLRAAYDPLGFSRAIYFSVSREKGIEARLQVDGSDVIERSFDRPDTRPGSAILRVLRGEAGDEAGVGVAGELSAPLVDVRGWYVLSALQTAAGTLGVLYVDGHACPVPREWEAGLVRALTTIASVAIDNGILFAQTRELALRDPLTGLYNRRAFSERLLSEIDTARKSERSLTYVMLDVDDFKRINDRGGHAHGDSVLCTLADTLSKASRAQDVVGRYAGDEFVVLLVDVEPPTARVLVTRLSAELQAAGLSCSLGAASFPRDATDAATLLGAADRALYATKAAGKNGFSFA